MIVTLTHREMLHCYAVGALRDLQTRERKGFGRHGTEGRPVEVSLQQNVFGAFGEAGLAKAIGEWDAWYANAVGDPKALDVPPWEVRTAPPAMSLIVYEQGEENHEDAPFVLAYVTGKWPTLSADVDIMGWSYLPPLRQQRNWREPPRVRYPAYFAPCHELTLFRSLQDIRDTTDAILKGALTWEAATT